MAAEHEANDDLYRYDGYDKVTSDVPDVPDAPQLRQPRQDSVVDFSTMADAIHYAAVGTLFALQTAADTPLQGTANIAPQRQRGAESSVFAIHDANVERKRSNASKTIAGLRQWLEAFAISQAHADRDNVSTAEDHGSPHISRKRSLSARTAEHVSMRFPPQTSTECSHESTESAEFASHRPIPIDNDDETDVSLQDERLNLLLSVALPLSPVERTLKWEERQRAAEEYNAIERARTTGIELKRIWAKDREEWMGECVESRKEYERRRRLGEERWQDRNMEADIKEDLDYDDYLLETAQHIMRLEDTGRYIVPRMWNMEDRPRRTRLYSNLGHLCRYLEREMSVVHLLEGRLEYLRDRKSKQQEATVKKETKNLETHIELRLDAESEYDRLVYDYLGWAIAQTTLDIQESTGSTLKSAKHSSTNDIPPFILRHWIAPSPELRKRFFRLRDLESQLSPGERPIPVRQPLPGIDQWHDGSPGDDDLSMKGPVRHHREREFQYDIRTSRTLPRSFKSKKTRLLALLEQRGEPDFPVPTLDRKMKREPTSPAKPAKTGYLPSPKPKPRMLTRLSSLPSADGCYTPPPQAPLRLNKSASLRVKRHTNPYGLDADGVCNCCVALCTYTKLMM